MLNWKLPQSRALTHADLCPGGPMQLYRATAERHFVLIRGGDSRFKNVLDCRQEVHESALREPAAIGRQLIATQVVKLLMSSGIAPVIEANRAHVGDGALQ